MSCVLIDNHLSSRLSYNMNKFDVQFPCYFRLSMFATSSHLTQFYFSFIFTVFTNLDVQWAQFDYVSSDDSEKIIAVLYYFPPEPPEEI